MLVSTRFELRYLSDWFYYCLQAAHYTVWTVVCVRLLWWLATGWTVWDFYCGVCQIGGITCCVLVTILFVKRYVSDGCSDWLQAGQYKIWTVVCVMLVWWLSSFCTSQGLNCGVCQIGVMNGYMLGSIRFEMRCVRMLWWLATGCTDLVLNSSVCQIGVMTSYSWIV